MKVTSKELKRARLVVVCGDVLHHVVQPLAKKALLRLVARLLGDEAMVAALAGCGPYTRHVSLSRATLEGLLTTDKTARQVVVADPFIFTADQMLQHLHRFEHLQVVVPMAACQLQSYQKLVLQPDLLFVDANTHAKYLPHIAELTGRRCDWEAAIFGESPGDYAVFARQWKQLAEKPLPEKPCETPDPPAATSKPAPSFFSCLTPTTVATAFRKMGNWWSSRESAPEEVADAAADIHDANDDAAQETIKPEPGDDETIKSEPGKNVEEEAELPHPMAAATKALIAEVAAKVVRIDAMASATE